jgi:hypothetical protein
MGLAQQLTEGMQRRIFGIAVEDLRKMVADVRNEIADLTVAFNGLQKEVKSLREEMERTRAGERSIEDMTLAEVLALHPGCHDVLERFGVHGGGTRTLRDAAKEAEDADLLTIVATIQNLLKGS